MNTDSRLVAHFSGFVQGVGFRITTHSIASQMPIRGFVKNLPDGRVELVAEGARDVLETLLARIRSEMNGNIRDARTSWGPATGEFGSFTIRR